MLRSFPQVSKCFESKGPECRSAGRSPRSRSFAAAAPRTRETAVLELLKDENWCRERIFNFGWYEASRLHVEDCKLLRTKAEASKSASAGETRKIVLSCLKKMSAILSEESPNLTDTSRIEKAMALHLVGFTLADNGGVGDALTQYKNGMTLMTQPNHPLNTIITYSQAVLHLVRNDHDKCLKKLKACLKVLKENDVSHGALSALLQQEAVQLKGDALLTACDYNSAEATYEEALDLMSEDSPIETGSALYRRGILHCSMGELNQAIAAINESINVKLGSGETCTIGLCHAYIKVGDLHFEFLENDDALKNYHHALDIAEDLEEEGNEYTIALLNGKISFLKNDCDGYNKCFDEVRETIKKVPRLFLDQSAWDLRSMAKIYLREEKLIDAVSIFREALELTSDRPESLERSSTLMELGYCLHDQGESIQAIKYLQSSLDIRKTKLGDCELVLDIQVALGNIFKELQMHQEYLSVSKEVMYLTEKLYKGDEEKAASALYGVAEAYEVLDEYDQAIGMYEECNEMLKRAFCNDHPDVANCLQKMAILQSLHGDYVKAFESYSMALRICRVNFEPSHPQIAKTLYATGVVARKKGDYDSARLHLQDALKIQKEHEVANETCLSLIELGNIHRLMKEAGIAVGCYERGLDILLADGINPTIPSSLNLALGHAKFTLKDAEGAAACFDVALKNRTELYGRDHTETALAARSMGIIKYVADSYAEARIYLSDFVRVMELKTTVNSVDYVLAQILLGQIHQSESRDGDSLDAWTKAESITEQNPEIASAISGLTELLQRLIEVSQSKHSESTEQKSFFSRFADMARFEEEVGSGLPIAAQIDEILREYVFVDEY